MEDTLSLLRNISTKPDHVAPKISKWSIGMHTEHCYLSTIAICRALERSSTPAPPSKFSLLANLVFLFGRIPRGRAMSPEAVLPHAGLPHDSLENRFTEALELFLRAKNFDANAWFLHPVFGPLKREKALRFIEIHNRHHLRIVRDIVSTPPQP